MSSSSTDRIEKSITLRAPRSRVWRALTDSGEFSTWFRVTLDGKFAVGATVTGVSTHPECAGMKFEAEVVRMDDERVFAFRWQPCPPDPDQPDAEVASTVVEFRLADGDDGGTQLTMIESGFDQLPAGGRHEAFVRNEGGWTEQMKNIQAHVDA